MTISDVQIANIAIGKAGSDSFITSFSDELKTARLMNVFFEPVRDRLLRSYLWKFARKRYVLAPLVQEPAFDGGKYFQIPNDCLRVVGMDDRYFQGYGRWYIEGDKIVADTSVLNMVGIQRITDPSLFDPIFAEAFATQLAHELCSPLAQDQTLKDRIKQDAKELVIMAAHVGATEQDSQHFISEAIIGAR